MNITWLIVRLLNRFVSQLLQVELLTWPKSQEGLLA